MIYMWDIKESSFEFKDLTLLLGTKVNAKRFQILLNSTALRFTP